MCPQIIAVGVAYWESRLWASGAWLPGHPSNGLYVLLGYAEIAGSVAWFASGGGSILFFLDRLTDKLAAQREREEERAKGRAEWESKYGKSDGLVAVQSQFNVVCGCDAGRVSLRRPRVLRAIASCRPYPNSDALPSTYIHVHSNPNASHLAYCCDNPFSKPKPSSHSGQ